MNTSFTDAAGAAPQAAPGVTLVLGSGSVKCAASLGVARALQNAGIRIERVVGCSGGAIFGSLIAKGVPMDQAIKDAIGLWTREITGRKNRMTMLRILAPNLFGFRADNFGFRRDNKIRETFHAYYGDARIEDTPIPLHITATDFHTGELVELNEGPIDQALRASMSIPFAFAPVRHGNRLLMDGYLSDPLPVTVAIKHGAHVIVALGFDTPGQEQVHSPARFAFQISAIMSSNLMKARMAFHNAVHHSELITLVPEFAERVRLFDTAKLPYIVETGERTMWEQIPYLKKILGMDHGDAHAQPQ